MPGEINCIFTKGLIPFVEKEVGSEGAAAICRAAGRSRDYLMADHNWIPVAVADQLVTLCQGLMHEPDQERWARRYGESFMDWKPREERSYLGTYSMGIGNPRAAYERAATIYGHQSRGLHRLDILEVGRHRALYRWTPLPGQTITVWSCTWVKVQCERFPTNWGLPRAEIVESTCAAKGGDACRWDIRWENPSRGARFWAPSLAGATISALLGAAGVTSLGSWPLLAVAPLPLIAGVALGHSLRESHQRQHTQRLLDLQSEEIIYSNRELEKKFAELETRIEQLSLLTDLSAAVSGTLDPEKIYDHTLSRLVHLMRYEKAYLFVVDRDRHVLCGHRMAGLDAGAVPFEGVEVPLDPKVSASARAAITGQPVLVNDVERTDEPVHLPLIQAHQVRSFVAVPLRVREQVFGTLSVTASDVGRFDQGDVDLLTAVASHVALAIDKAESFQTIEDLSRSLEDKVRVRTEQLRSTNEELRTAYRDLQVTQQQLIQREKMASVGQLVAGVAHELNNPIGFISSNVTTLEDFVRRLRAMLETYQDATLPEADRTRVAERRRELKIDYALKYLDAMIDGIRDGADRTRKIVRDLRVFARTPDDVWQPVDLNEELESSLTLLNHLLKDRITVRREYGALGAVECVRSQIDQVFLNVLANAAQAIHGPGTITIATRREGPRAIIRIADTGPGIPAEAIGRIFDPFFTTKPVGEGTGLGLSISYEIVTKHGGEIRAENRPEGGAVFTLELPVARVAADTSAGTSA
ncbi:MAG TPA: ATP-binding protein [Methylomirabilota bacterium]|nr:ATP-binding protein [Methylomirabilota bacterium]